MPTQKSFSGQAGIHVYSTEAMPAWGKHRPASVGRVSTYAITPPFAELACTVFAPGQVWGLKSGIMLSVKSGTFPGETVAHDRTSIFSGPFFAGLAPEDRAAILHRATLRKFAVGEALIAQGRRATALFVITKGRIKIWRSSEDGVPLTLALLGPGAPIGTLGAAKDVRNHATVSALTAVEALVWPLAGLREAMDGNATLALNVLRTVSGYAEQMIERLEEVSSVPVEQRLARTLLRMARGSYGESTQDGCELPLSRQDMADLTSATLPTVSRIMSRWRQLGWITGGRGRVRLLDCKALIMLAERTIS